MQPTEEQGISGFLPRPDVTYRPSLAWETVLPLATRLLVWGIIFGLLALLSSFFTLIFLTFVFAYLQSSIVDGLLRFAPKRRTSLVILVGGLFLSLVISVSVFLAPQVYQQAAGFARGFTVYMQGIDRALIDLANRYPFLQEAIPELKAQNAPIPPNASAVSVPNWAMVEPPTSVTPPTPAPWTSASRKRKPASASSWSRRLWAREPPSRNSPTRRAKNRRACSVICRTSRAWSASRRTW